MRLPCFSVKLLHFLFCHLPSVRMRLIALHPRLREGGADGIEMHDHRHIRECELVELAIQEVTFGRFRLKAYQQTVQNFMQRLREFCTSHGVSFFTASSDTALEQLLLKQLREAEVWG